MAIKKKRTKVLAIIGQTVLWVVVVFLAAVSLFMTIDKSSGYTTSLAGYRIAAISSQSMSYVNPANKDELEGIGGKIARGDCVVAQDVKTIEELEMFDTVLYVDNKGGLVCHRVVDIDVENNTIIARGDTNVSVDGVISFTAVRGKVVRIVPFIGHVVLFLQTYYGLLSICGTVFFVVLGVLIYNVLNKRGSKVKVVDRH